MLDELAVANLGLIADAHLEPGPGLIALTGETGAGKTLLLGALRLLRGDTARSDRIGPDGNEARVEGRFVLDDQEITVARRVVGGRSRAYVDGVMCPAGSLEERLAGVVEIVGQHEHISLGRETSIRALLDASLDSAGNRALSRYRDAWANHQQLLADRESIGGDRRALERELDLSRHQAAEVDAAGFAPGDDAALASRLQRMRHSEDISSALGQAHSGLGEEGIADPLGDAIDAVRSAAQHDPGLDPLADRLAAAAAEIGEIAVEARRSAEALEHDPHILEEAEQRMGVLADLRRKYGDTLDEVLAYGRRAAAEADRLEALLERSDSLEAEISASADIVAAAGLALAESWRRSAEQLSSSAIGHLRDLGFRDPVVELSVADSTPGPSGGDTVSLGFASDAALEPGPVGRVASGGELSRLVLAIRLAGGVADVPVVAFDEIDAGIGGSTALAMGAKLAALSAGRQVLVVTHLPQVAAFADTQFVVERTDTAATVRRVDGEERVEELSRMLGGLPESEQGRGHAAELLSLGRRDRSTG